jgi:hypothetical protein
MQLSGLTDVVDLALAGDSGCALEQSGQVWCWGANRYGQTGIGTTWGLSEVPAQTLELTDAQSIYSHGEGYCALRATGQVWCWGQNGSGRFGLTTTSGNNSTPVEVPFYSTKTITDMAGGEIFVCALEDSGRVHCAGHADFGNARPLGDNQHDSRAMDRFYPAPTATIAPIEDELGLCRDGNDNDALDGADCADPDCASDLGAQVRSAVHLGYLSGDEGNYFLGSCGGNGREHVFTWTAPTSATYTISTEGSDLSTVLYVLDTCAASATNAELACDVNTASDGRSSLTLNTTAGTTYIIVVDSPSNAGLASYVLNITN